MRRRPPQVYRELRRLQAQLGLDTDVMVFRQLLASVLRYGSKADKAAAKSCCTALNLDPDCLDEGASFDLPPHRR